MEFSKAGDLDQSYQGWQQFTLQLRNRETFGAYFELQPRRRWVERGDLYHFIIRSGMTWRASSRLTFLLGPAWTPSLSPSYRDEWRLWEQAQYHWPLEEDYQLITFRSRLEQRWIQNAGSIGHRFMQMIRWDRGINAKLEQPGTIGLGTYLEVYFNFNSDSGGIFKAGLDQTEFFFGPTWQVSKPIRIETGYLNNYTPRVTSASQMYHVWYIAFKLVV